MTRMVQCLALAISLLKDVGRLRWSCASSYAGPPEGSSLATMRCDYIDSSRKTLAAAENAS